MLGQADVAYTQADTSGALVHVGWTAQSSDLSVGFSLDSMHSGYQTLGARKNAEAPRLQGAATLGLNMRRYGALSFAYTYSRARDDERIRTVEARYAPIDRPWGRVDLSAFYVDGSGDEPFLVVGVGLSMSLRGDVDGSARVESRGGRLSSSATLQHASDPLGGFGWRATTSIGAVRRVDATLTHQDATHEASVEYSETAAGNGARAQLAGGIVWIGRDIAATRPVRESFALVDLGAPNVHITRDNRAAGVTGAHGKLWLTGLRAYEANRIGMDIADLPQTAEPLADSIDVTPAARAGVLARFPIVRGSSGEVHLRDARGAAIPAGSILVRQSDGARFAVGHDGVVYLSGLVAPERFVIGTHCAVVIAPANVGEVLTCRAAA